MNLLGVQMMADLLGIIAPLKKFLSDTNETISLPFGKPDQEILSFPKGRLYSIPDFQREIRWGNENVAQLIDDISSQIFRKCNLNPAYSIKLFDYWRAAENYRIDNDSFLLKRPL